MLKKLPTILMMAIAVGLGGAFAGYATGSLMYERAWQRVQTNLYSIQGDVGGYLCSAGWLPIELGVLGASLGVVIGLGVGIGAAVWVEAKESE